MLKKYQGFNFIFLLLVVVQLMTESDMLTQLFLVNGIHYFTKPLIALSLFGLLLHQTGLRGRFSKRIGAGLIFCLAGDVLLMFDDWDGTFFLYGLTAFLIGQLCYASAFYLDYSLNTTVYKRHTKNAILGFLFYGLILCTLLWTSLDHMKIPVILYALAILAMGVMAVSRFGRVNTFSYRLIMYGALLFVLSDSILAVNRFLYPFGLSGLFVMAFYIAAQYLIVMGNLERKIKKKVEEI